MHKVYILVRRRLGSCLCFFFFQAEDGIRDLVRSRGLGDVYKRQVLPEVFTAVTLLLPPFVDQRAVESTLAQITAEY